MPKIFLLLFLCFFLTKMNSQPGIAFGFKYNDPGSGDNTYVPSELPNGDGYYRIKSLNTNKFLIASKWSAYVNQRAEFPFIEDQIFYFEKLISNGIPAYRISLYRDNNVIVKIENVPDASRPKLILSSPIMSNGANSTDQLFVLYKVNGGFVTKMRPQSSTNYLDVNNSNVADELMFDCGARNNLSNQNFSFIKVDDLNTIVTKTSGCKEYKPLDRDNPNTLIFGDELNRGQYIVSRNNAFSLLLDKEGLLRVYRGCNPNLLPSNETPLYTYLGTGGKFKFNKFSVGSSPNPLQAQLGVFFSAETGVESFLPSKNGLSCFILLTDAGEIQILGGVDYLRRFSGDPFWSSGAKDEVRNLKLTSFELLSTVVNAGGESRSSASSLTIANGTNSPQKTEASFTITESENTSIRTSNEWATSMALNVALTASSTTKFSDDEAPGISAEVNMSLRAAYGHAETTSGSETSSKENSRSESRTISFPAEVNPLSTLTVTLVPEMQTVVQQYQYKGLVTYASNTQKVLSGIVTIEKVYPFSYSITFK